MDRRAACTVPRRIQRLHWTSQVHGGISSPNSSTITPVNLWESDLTFFTFCIRVWRRWSGSLVNTLQWSQNGRPALLCRSSSATFLQCFKTGVPLMWVAGQFANTLKCYPKTTESEMPHGSRFQLCYGCDKVGTQCCLDQCTWNECSLEMNRGSERRGASHNSFFFSAHSGWDLAACI